MSGEVAIVTLRVPAEVWDEGGRLDGLGEVLEVRRLSGSCPVCGRPREEFDRPQGDTCSERCKSTAKMRRHRERKAGRR